MRITTLLLTFLLASCGNISKPPATQPREKEPEKLPAEGTYILQLGAFQKPEKAAALVNELKSKGYSPHTDTITVPGKGTLTRVRIGAFRDLSEAQRKAAEIESKVKIPAVISRR